MITGLVLVSLFIGISYVRAAWVDPVWNDGAGAAPWGGTTEAPLNTSVTPQTVQGDLTIKNTLEVLDQGIQTNNLLSVDENFRVSPDLPDDDGEICINDTGDGALCKNNFDFEEGNFVHINPVDPDLGFIRLGDPDPTKEKEGYMIIEGDINESGSPIALYAKAGRSSSNLSHAIMGYAGSGDTLPAHLSAGVYGVAGSNSPFSIGVGGTAPSLVGPAYAAYFKGKVEIDGCLDFAGDCKYEWPTGEMEGDFVKLDPETNQQGNVDLSPGSTSVFTSLILGGDPSGLGIGITCGDGSCNNGETIFTCEVDCFTVYKVSPTNITDGTAVITWQTSAPASTVVNYGTTPDLGSEIVDETLAYDHAVLLSSLNYSTAYYYQVQSIADSGAYRASSVLNFTSLIDTTPPFPPANLHNTTPKPDQIPLAWYQTLQDNPGGSGFSHFVIYREGIPFDTTTSAWYIDYFVDQDAYYSYEITAVDMLGNESEPSNAEIIHVPTACVSNSNCTNPLYPVCYGELGCGEPLPGGSPVVLKEIPESYLQYEDPGGWEGGGGW